ncbi:endorhamnosidase, partial [Shigella flexneri]|nr:endorhamnosidase [Shigella flexneri]
LVSRIPGAVQFYFPNLLKYDPDQFGPDLIEQLAQSGKYSQDNTKGDAMIGVKQPLPKAVLRTQHDKNKEAISILDFGVIDDGVTDNYQAIQNAIDAVASLPSGGELFIPASNQAVGYIVGSTLLIPGGVNIRGVGKASQLRAKSGLTGSVLRLSYDSDTIGRYLRNIRVTGNNTCNGIDTNITAEDSVIRQVYGWVFDNVMVNEVETAYLMQGLWHSKFIACQAGTCRVGLHFLGQCVSVSVSSCHFSRGNYSADESFGIRIQPQTYAWSSEAVRSEAIILDSETMCIGFKNAVYVHDCLDLHMEQPDLDYCGSTGVVIENVNGGFSFSNSWIAADADGTEQFTGIYFRTPTSTQSHKIVSGVHINTANKNTAANNQSIAIEQSAIFVFVSGCTLTGDEWAVNIVDINECVSFDKCIFNKPLCYLRSGGVSVTDCYLAGITEVQKPEGRYNTYRGCSGVPSVNGIINVPVAVGATSGSAAIPNPGNLTYRVRSLFGDPASSGDKVSVSVVTINVTRPSPVGVALPSMVEYLAI